VRQAEGIGKPPSRKAPSRKAQGDPFSAEQESIAAESSVDSFDDIDEHLVKLLEETDDDPVNLWDEEIEELPESNEAGEEPVEKAPWNPKEWLNAFLECTDASPLGPAVRQMIDDCNLMSHKEASQDVLGFLEDENASTWPSHCKLVDKIWAK
jgi:hypothetical protein